MEIYIINFLRYIFNLLTPIPIIMKIPNADESKKCLQIRKRNKRGEYTNPDDITFCEKILKLYPEWYKKTEDEVFNDTVPFGSDVRRKDGKWVYLK